MDRALAREASAPAREALPRIRCRGDLQQAAGGHESTGRNRLQAAGARNSEAHRKDRPRVDDVEVREPGQVTAKLGLEGIDADFDRCRDAIKAGQGKDEAGGDVVLGELGHRGRAEDLLPEGEPSDAGEDRPTSRRVKVDALVGHA